MNERPEIEAFDDAYARLNAAQKQAVDTIEGPVMVIAGPGTGKTQILTLRIANILRTTDTTPESILALTFTEAGVAAMQERLRRYLGSDAYRIGVYTFHGFAGTVIRDHPDAFPRIIGGTVANEIDKLALVETALQLGSYSLLRPIGNPAYYLKPIIAMISELKRENVTPDRLTEIVAVQEHTLMTLPRLHERGAHAGKVRGEYAALEKTITKNREFATVYRTYEALKTEARFYDYDDMILETVAVLENDESVLRDLQERYHYLLADEHQDVNAAQNRILELLASFHQAPNIFVVGDEKQAIYRFQGASLENFLYFEDAYPSTTTIALTDNYRSGQLILDAAHALIAVEEGPLQKLRVPLTAKTGVTPDIGLRAYEHQAVEDEALLAAVAADIAAGVDPASIAVIVRTNKEADVLAQRLRGSGITAHASADSDILEHPLTHAVEALLAAAATAGDDASLFALLHAPYLKLSLADVVRIAGARSYTTPLSAILSDPEKLRSLGVESIAAAGEIMALLAAARARAVTESPQRVVAFLIEESGLLEEALAHDPHETGRVLRRLYDEVEHLVQNGTVRTLADLLRLLRRYREHGIGLSVPYLTLSEAEVVVMTAHKAKGLEYDTVYLPHLTDRQWGGKVRRQHFNIPYTRHEHTEYADDDDERRLLYVALTRAKRKLALSYAHCSADGAAEAPSRLLEGLAPVIGAAEPTATPSDFSPVGILTESAVPDASPTDLWRQTLAQRGFSATSLNNYLKSPWEYLYRNVLRIPETQPLHMLYGTAVHAALERSMRAYQEQGSLPAFSTIGSFLTEALERLPLSTDELTRLHEEGLAMLAAYVPHLQSTLAPRTEVELKLRVTLETGLPELPELPLTGMFDRLDLDDEGRLLRVIDYKTGTPKTRNAIEGKTKSDDGGYKRQLIFYALLLSLYDHPLYQTRTCVLSFVKPDAKGIIHEELFTITDEEIESLKATIIEAARAIISGQFLARPPLPEETDYYRYAVRWRRSA